jgi:hypothetical protein
MPPSGYTNEQSRHLVELLRSCAQALVVEAAENGESLVQALEREISSIKAYISDKAETAAQRGILLITQGFYSEVLAFTPADRSAFNAAVEGAARQIESEMLGINIPILKRAL